MRHFILMLTILMGSLSWTTVTAHSGNGHLQNADSQNYWWTLFLREAYAGVTVYEDIATGLRIIEGDGWPDHLTGTFPNRNNPHSISSQRYRFQVPLNPSVSGRITPIGRASFGVAINGIPFDPGTAEFYGNDPNSGWRGEAIGGLRDLGLDQNNAHVQPNGAYHYHALPTALANRSDYRTGPVLLGYAADGFPIYTPYGYSDADDPQSPLKNLKSSYQLKPGNRPGGPGGQHDGAYTQDWQYVPALGDLDECNGRAGTTPEYPEGTYYYVVTEAFPFIPRCWVGNPDASFQKAATGGRRMERNGQGNRAGRRGPPAEAIEACNGLREGAQCGFTSPRGHEIQGTCFSPRGQHELACRPLHR